jgi:putative SOS response-associated peptidase YedK
MCGRLNVTDNPGVRVLCDMIGLPLYPMNDNPQHTLRFSRFIKAGSTVSIIREKVGMRSLSAATWWLLQKANETGFEPDFKWASFNTRYDKLNVPKSAGYKAFRESRGIIPASGFGETEGKGKSAIYTDFTALEGEAIAFGGLCREWLHPGTGVSALSCSVITLPPADWLLPYHTKASPLMLPQEDDTMDLWLDRGITNVEIFNDLLKPRLVQGLNAQRIDKPGTHNPIGNSVEITNT